MDDDAKIEQLSKRWREIDGLLAELAAGRATPENADPTAREQELLGELDRLEYEIGVIQLERSRRDRENEIRDSQS